jgi:hypothetical protein
MKWQGLNPTYLNFQQKAIAQLRNNVIATVEAIGLVLSLALPP